MHIVQFVAASGPGGIEQVAFDYARAMKIVGIQCTTIADLTYKEKSKYITENLELISDNHCVRWYNILKYYGYKRLTSRRNTCATIVHVGRAIQLARLSSINIPVISVAHTDNMKLRLRADAMICVNTSLARVVRDIWQDKKPVFTIPNPISVEISEVQKIISNRVYKKYSNDPIVIGVMGKHIKHKGYYYFLTGLKKLMDMNIPFKCVFGGDGEERKSLENISKSLGIKDFVDFRGWITNKKKFFEEIDLFCLPSLYEPFGLVVTEAMAFGRPVVATNTDGPSEIIRQNIDGVIVPKGDAGALADAFALFSARRDLLVDMGFAASNRVLEHFSHNRIGTMLREAIMETTHHYCSHAKSLP